MTPFEDRSSIKNEGLSDVQVLHIGSDADDHVVFRSLCYGSRLYMKLVESSLSSIVVTAAT